MIHLRTQQPHLDSWLDAVYDLVGDDANDRRLGRCRGCGMAFPLYSGARGCPRKYCTASCLKAHTALQRRSRRKGTRRSSRQLVHAGVR